MFELEKKQWIEKIEREKKQWEQEKQEVHDKSLQSGEQIFELNVSGVTEGFVISKKLACAFKETALEAMFSGRHTIAYHEGKVFIERDPKIFRHLMNYLRNQ